MGAGQTKPIEVDFENATPSSSEQQLFSRVSGMLDRGLSMLKVMETYVDCGDAIRDAMGAHGDTNKEEVALSQVSQRVMLMKDWYEISKEIEDATPQILNGLSQGDLSEHQGFALLLSRLLDFVLRFDEIKIATPKILNDLAYFRRCVVKGRSAQAGGAVGEEGASASHVGQTVGVDDAGRCQVFLSAPRPMMNAISSSTMRLYHGNEAVMNTLPTLANSCCFMVSKRKFTRPDVNERCMRAMVGAIVLYDHVHPQGAFHKRSPLQIRRCVQLLRGFDPPPPPELIDTLRYCTKHLGDESTPPAVKKLLAG